MRQAQTSGPGGIPPSVLKAKFHIENNFHSEITLDDIARAAHLSRQHISELFRNYFKQSPVAYAIGLRLDYARELLCRTNWSISKIAEESGFKNVYYFCRIFRKKNCCTPTDFRKKRHNK